MLRLFTSQALLRRLRVSGSGACSPVVVPSVSSSTLAMTCRAVHSSSSKSPHDSNVDNAFSSQHFDLQDVDADRLSHFYWDRGDEDGPYGVGNLWDMTEGQLYLAIEGGMDSMMFVDKNDAWLLNSEYLTP